VSEPRIIHDDSHLRAIYRPGDSDFLLITFGDLTMPVDGLRFCADRPAETLGMACLGIMPKWPHWYPADFLRAVRPALEPILAQHPERVGYGGSMGGHGAIKHSGLLGASVTLAMCPQWSIDPSECGFRPGWMEHLGPHNAGMGIRESDTGGRIYVFSDRHELRDALHARRIVSSVPTTRWLDVPWVRHNVTRVLAGTNNLAALIDAARRDDLSALGRRVATARRTGDARLKSLTATAHARHPILVRRCLEARAKSNAWAHKVLHELYPGVK